MKFHPYSSPTEYIEAQKRRAADRLAHNVVWVSEQAIAAMVDFIRAHRPDARFCLCHGASSGTEQRLVKKRLNISVLGTELLADCAQFPDTIQWDFHEIKPEWLGAVDFIYSNALDHSPTPDVALRQWLRCLAPGGFCFIDWSEGHSDAHVTAVDCFGASVAEMREWLKSFGNVVAELPVTDQYREHVLFVLTRNQGGSL